MEQIRFCSKCGAQLNPDDKFCPICGEPVDNTNAFETSTVSPAPAAGENSELKSKENTVFILGILSICLGSILLAIIGMILARPIKQISPKAKKGYILCVVGLVVSVILILVSAILFNLYFRQTA